MTQHDGTDAHASEAMAAVAGMIETYGTKAADGASVFVPYVSDRLDDWKYYTSIIEYRLHGRLPGDVAVVQWVWGGKTHGEVIFQHHASKMLCTSRVAAQVRVAEILLERLEAIRRQYDSLRAEIAEAVDGTVTMEAVS